MYRFLCVWVCTSKPNGIRALIIDNLDWAPAALTEFVENYGTSRINDPLDLSRCNKDAGLDPYLQRMS